MATTKKASKKAIKKTAKKVNKKVTKKAVSKPEVQENKSKSFFVTAIVLLIIFIVLSVLGTVYLLNQSKDDLQEFDFPEQLEEEELVIPTTFTAEDVVLTVNQMPVTLEDIQLTKMNLAQQNPMGQEISDAVAIEQTVNLILIQEEIEKRGLTVTRAEAEENFESIAQQQGVPLEDFKQLVEQQGMNYEDLLVNIQLQMGLANLVEELSQGQEISVSQEEIRTFYEQNINSIPEGVTFEEVQPQIEEILLQEKEDELLIILLDELKEDANIEYNI